MGERDAHRFGLQRLLSRALDSSFDPSQFLPVVGDDLVGSGQEGSQLRLRRQVTLDLQD